MSAIFFYGTMTFFVLMGGAFLQGQLVALYILLMKLTPEEGVTLFRDVDKELNSALYKHYFEGVINPTKYLTGNPFLRLSIGLILPILAICFGVFGIASGLTEEKTTIGIVVGIVCLLLSLVYVLGTLMLLISIRHIHKNPK